MERKTEDGSAQTNAGHQMNIGEPRVPVAATYGYPVYDDIYNDPKFAHPIGVDLFKVVNSTRVKSQPIVAEVAETDNQGS